MGGTTWCLQPARCGRGFVQGGRREHPTAPGNAAAGVAAAMAARKEEGGRRREEGGEGSEDPFGPHRPGEHRRRCGGRLGVDPFGLQPLRGHPPMVIQGDPLLARQLVVAAHGTGVAGLQPGEQAVIVEGVPTRHLFSDLAHQHIPQAHSAGLRLHDFHRWQVRPGIPGRRWPLIVFYEHHPLGHSKLGLGGHGPSVGEGALAVLSFFHHTAGLPLGPDAVALLLVYLVHGCLNPLRHLPLRSMVILQGAVQLHKQV
mmetsp:Transcript_22177/g.48564  ORF Transcript_22177/g.48564 Transcript_22177/m.48564 type:complete len:257 (+) Transcript_22177:88-858(+)